MKIIGSYPKTRLRRLRKYRWLRNLISENNISPNVPKPPPISKKVFGWNFSMFFFIYYLIHIYSYIYNCLYVDLISEYTNLELPILSIFGSWLVRYFFNSVFISIFDPLFVVSNGDVNPKIIMG